MRMHSVRTICLLPLLCGLLLPAVGGPPETGKPDFDWENLPVGRWVAVPTIGVAAPKVFHGGAALIPEKSLVIFFGSDTHAPTPLEKGESNSAWRLNLDRLEWRKDYEQDPKSTYRILPDRQTETSTGRPWAMHTFADVEWDPTARRVVVVSGPLHARFNPAKRFPMFREKEWWVTLKHSHWEYDPDSLRWERLDVEAPRVFAAATVWDSDRGRLVAHNGAVTWEFDRAARKWEEYPARTREGWHLNMVYDTLARKVLLLGNNTSDSTLYGYDGASHSWSVIETQGRPLPANGSTIAYDTRNHVMLYLANDFRDQYYNPSGKSVTFVYHSADRRWERLGIPSPPLYGMNYLMQYDPSRNVFLHFEKSADSGDRIRVWAFRFK